MFWAGSEREASRELTVVAARGTFQRRLPEVSEWRCSSETCLEFAQTDDWSRGATHLLSSIFIKPFGVTFLKSTFQSVLVGTFRVSMACLGLEGYRQIILKASSVITLRWGNQAGKTHGVFNPSDETARRVWEQERCLQEGDVSRRLRNRVQVNLHTLQLGLQALTEFWVLLQVCGEKSQTALSGMHLKLQSSGLYRGTLSSSLWNPRQYHAQLEKKVFLLSP